MRMCIALCVLLVASPPVLHAQETDPFDLENKGINDGAVSTVNALATIEEQARALFGDGACTGEVVAVLDDFARKANAMGNVISAGLEPFYDASLDDRRSFRGTRELIPFETLANQYKRKRNIAMVMRAECIAKSGDRETAISVYYRALQLLSIDNTEWWTRARNGLYALVGVSTPPGNS